MNIKNSHLSLLPSGFVDLMPEEAELEARSINILMDLFTSYNYQRIKPPLLEFEDSLLAPGPGVSLAQDTFRLMDPISLRMMGVRADITPQIARIVCSRLSDQADPIRLTYANDVLRNKAGQLRTSRQFCQVGCEIIYDKSATSYAEIVILAGLGLKELGIANVTFDFTIPRLLDILMDKFQVEDDLRAEIKEILSKRDRDSLGQISHQVTRILSPLLEKAGRLSNSLNEIIEFDLPSEISSEFETLRIVSEEIKTAFSDLGIDAHLTFDPFETRGFDYHHGLAFTMFAENIRGELGRGGAYSVSFGQKSDADAIGFTLYMDTLRSGLQIDVSQKEQVVNASTSWSEMEKLRMQNYKIIRKKD